MSEVLTTRARQFAVMALATTLLAGCAQTKSFFTGQSLSDSSDDTGILGAPGIEYYLNDMRLLASGDLAAHAEIFADSQSAAQLTPGPQTNLRYALVLATPGHSESDAAQAASLLREILAAPQLLTEGEIALATISLKSTEELAVAQSEVQRTRASLARAAQSRETATNQRLTDLDAENRRLRAALREAEEKLVAITSIERSIRDQE